MMGIISPTVIFIVGFLEISFFVFNVNLVGLDELLFVSITCEVEEQHCEDDEGNHNSWIDICALIPITRMCAPFIMHATYLTMYIYLEGAIVVLVMRLMHF